MKTLFTVGAGLAALVSTAACAQSAPASGHGPDQPKTRIAVQKHVAERFAKWDTSKDGKVTKAEFDAVRAQRMAEWKDKSNERRAERFAMLDSNQDGNVNRAEFNAARESRDGKGGPGMRRGPGGPGGFGGRGMAFERMDTNKDGTVTLAEASAKPLERFDAIDTNRDGTISPAEHDAARQMRRGGPNA